MLGHGRQRAGTLVPVRNPGLPPTLMTEEPRHRNVRSFVKRAGRTTRAQQRALSELMSVYGVDDCTRPLTGPGIFKRDAALVMEIGFGNGELLATVAAAQPDTDFIGIEVHEDPWLRPQQRQELVDGMVFCVEPKLWHKGEESGNVQKVKELIIDCDGDVDLAAQAAGLLSVSCGSEVPSGPFLTVQECTGTEALAAAGYVHYEVSAHALAGHQCRHNLNYWRFGDYLGIGAGAHGKRMLSNGTSLRTRKAHQPRLYLSDPAATERKPIPEDALAGEFMLNALRLVNGHVTQPFLESADAGYIGQQNLGSFLVPPAIVANIFGRATDHVDDPAVSPAKPVWLPGSTVFSSVQSTSRSHSPAAVLVGTNGSR